jgi:hypothetical protein
MLGLQRFQLNYLLCRWAIGVSIMGGYLAFKANRLFMPGEREG